MQLMQDVTLQADCCGDNCFAESRGAPYMVRIQTAGVGAPNMPEVSVVCLENPAQFREQVLVAKRELQSLAASGAPLTGAAKSGIIGSLVVASAAGGAGAAAAAGSADTSAVVAVLERIEQALNTGLAEMRSRH